MSFKPPATTSGYSGYAADHGIKSYATVAALQGESSAPPPAVALIHNYGLYDWNASSTDTEDEVSVIKVTALTTGRYIARI